MKINCALFKVFILGSIIAFACGCVAASSNNELKAVSDSMTESGAVRLPQIELADLEGKSYIFPKELPAEYNLIVFGFAHAQKDLTETWVAPALNLKKGQKNLAVFKVPVIDKKSGAIRLMIRNGMRSGITDTAARKRTLTLFIDKQKFVSAIGLKDDTQPAAMLFDQSGKVIWRALGKAKEADLAELTGLLSSSNPS